MITLTETQRKEIISSLRELGESVSNLLAKLDAKYEKETTCCGEDWLLSNLPSVEFSERGTRLEKRSDEDLYDMVTDFGMAAESMWSDLDGDGEWPNGSRAKSILDNFIKKSRKYSRPMIRG